MKVICHFSRILAVFLFLTSMCCSAFANTLPIILPYDPTYSDTRGDLEWLEIGEIFANYNELTGLEARAVTLEDVKIWHDGENEAGQVKRTIHRFVREQGTRYLMLVGDTGVFPIRQQFTGCTVAGDTFYEGGHSTWQPKARAYYRFFPTDDIFSGFPGSLYKSLIAHPYDQMFSTEEFVQHLENVGFAINDFKESNPF